MSRLVRLSLVASIASLVAVLLTVSPQATKARTEADEIFKTSESCVACHNGLSTSAGEDISIGSEWQASMMAHSSRDPYWQGSVRREIADHPRAADKIEDECSTCHMPMARAQAQASGRLGKVFTHLPVARHRQNAADRLAADGVSCTMCHQITEQNLGTPASFGGGFVLRPRHGAEARPIFGPFQVDGGRTSIMRSATDFKPTESAHVRASELCATCHTLYTEALGRQGESIGRLPEQMPYLEWRSSAYRENRSCQSCHMPRVEEETRMASVLGDPREGVSRHAFQGGNFFMLGMLNRYRQELGVEAAPQELQASAHRTLRYLESDAANVSIGAVEASAAGIAFDVSVQNQAGHKLPTGYPSRRAWLHVQVTDGAGQPLFESGGLTPSGLIRGNDNDADPLRIEPHYTSISSPDEVQIYESVMGDADGRPTTGLLSAVRFLKDNRLLPAGFDKRAVSDDIAVVGTALTDSDFSGGCDRVRYLVDVTGREGPFRIEVELRYQPIAFRWAENLKQYDAVEARRFAKYYESMSHASSAILAHATAKAANPER
jgi:hypothetical protein